MLDALPHKITTTEQPPFSQTAPHDVYLSSEEDASSSADDFSDFDFDSDNEQSKSTSTRRRGSHEDTARVVSVIFSGKPSIVNLPPRSTSPSSVGSPPRPIRQLQRTATEPWFGRRMSTSSSASSSILHPPRTSSMLPGRRLEKQRPQFLQIDPFASVKPDLERRETESPRPKTPTAMFKRTLSLVRKRSKPNLNQAAMQSRESLSIQTQFMDQVAEEPARADSPASAKSLTYNDILKTAKRRTQTMPMSPMSDPATPTTPMTPNSTRSRLRNGFSAATRRRSSIRA